MAFGTWKPANSEPGGVTFVDASDRAAALKQRATKSPNMLCFIEQFPLAMAAIANVHDYGRGPLVKGDYRPSLLRHLFGIGDHPDHDAAVAWNAIAQLEISLRAKGGSGIGA